MGRQVLIRRRKLALLMCLVMGLFTGCDGKNVDYSIEGETESTRIQDEGRKSGVAQFQDVDSWEETWTIQPLMEDVVIDAKITVPKAEQMSVIEVVEPEFDAAYKEQVANHIFDSEEIYYGDVNHLPKQDLEEIENYFLAGGRMRMEHSWEEEDEKTEQDFYAAMDNPKDTYTLVDEYTEKAYIGTYEGIPYRLIFEERKHDFDIRRVKNIHLVPKNLHDVCPEEMQETQWIVCEPWTRGNGIENQCKISEEEALKMAQRFVKKLGLDYPVESYSQPLVWGDATISSENTNDWIANGYVFSFDYGADDISFVDYGIEKDYTNFWHIGQANSTHIIYSMEARMQVYVTDAGVIWMSACNPLETSGVSGSVEMLSLDTIKSIIKEQLEENYEEFRFLYPMSGTRFDRMDLIYFRVEDKENPGHYSYIPTWRLSSLTQDEELHLITVLNPILINAIDGSVIDYYDET